MRDPGTILQHLVLAEAALSDEARTVATAPVPRTVRLHRWVHDVERLRRELAEALLRSIRDGERLQLEPGAGGEPVLRRLAQPPARVTSPSVASPARRAPPPATAPGVDAPAHAPTPPVPPVEEILSYSAPVGRAASPRMAAHGPPAPEPVPTRAAVPAPEPVTPPVGAAPEAPPPASPDGPVAPAPPHPRSRRSRRLRAAPPAPAVPAASAPPLPPPASPDAPVAPAPPPASPDALASLVEHAHNGGFHEISSVRVPRAPTVPPRPCEVDTADGLHAGVLSLERHVAGRHAWSQLIREDQRHHVGLAAAWGRYLQDQRPHVAGTDEDQQRIERIFPSLTQYQETSRPGAVHGLARKHTPRRGSWLDEALDHWRALQREPPDPDAPLRELVDVLASEPSPSALRGAVASALVRGLRPSDSRLVELMEPYVEALKGDRRVRGVRRAVRAQQKEVARHERVRQVPRWSHADLTRGKRALLVGGDRRQDAERRLKAFLELDELVWDTGWRKERVAANAAQVRQGSFDLVLIVRDFVTHMATDHLVPACKAASVSFAVVDRGYGLGQVRRALERVLLSPQ